MGLIIPKKRLFQVSSFNVQWWDCGEVSEANVNRSRNSLVKTWLHLLLVYEILYSDRTKLYKKSVLVCYISYFYPVIYGGRF